MTEIEILTARLVKKREEGMLDCHVTWGPSAHLLTQEQRAGHVNRLMDAIDAGDYEDAQPIGDSCRPKTDVAEFVKSL